MLTWKDDKRNPRNAKHGTDGKARYSIALVDDPGAWPMVYRLTNGRWSVFAFARTLRDARTVADADHAGRALPARCLASAATNRLGRKTTVRPFKQTAHPSTY